MKYLLVSVAAFAIAGTAMAEEYNTPQELIDKYTAMFQELDTDNSQGLSEEEISNTGLTSESFARLDINGNGVLELDEFLALATSSAPATESSGDAVP